MPGRPAATRPKEALDHRPGLPDSPAVPDVLVVSEVFPPAVGGSGLLLREVYQRFEHRAVTVFADHSAGTNEDIQVSPTMRVERVALATRHWGVMSPSGDAHHLTVARRIRRTGDRARTVVHCARALPEGVAAWVSHTMGGPRYICWSHGEDVSVALTSRELTWVMTRVFRSAEAVIANSRNTRDSVLALGLPDTRVHVVYPGVNPDRFHPDVDGRGFRDALLGDGDTLLLSVGRLQRRKGHDRVIEAVAALKDMLPGLRYAIVGDGEERPRLECLAAQAGVRDRVVFTGAVPEDTLPAYFAASDVFVLPNRRDGADIEGFGIVFLEAAACGKPVIGGNSGGVPEAIDHGRTGLLVDGTDVQELARAIDRLARDPAERQALGSAGRERVLRGFTWDHAAAQVVRIHNTIVADG